MVVVGGSGSGTGGITNGPALLRESMDVAPGESKAASLLAGHGVHGGPSLAMHLFNADIGAQAISHYSGSHPGTIDASAVIDGDFEIVPDGNQKVGDPVRIDVSVTPWVVDPFPSLPGLGRAELTVTITGAMTGAGNKIVKIGDKIHVKIEVSTTNPGNNTGSWLADGRVRFTVTDVPPPDIAAGGVSWRNSGEGGGIKLDYSINGSDLDAPGSVSFFWANSPTATTGASATSPKTTQTKVGQHSITINGNDFQAPTGDKIFLIAVFNGDQDTSNNQTNTKLVISPPTVHAFFTREDGAVLPVDPNDPNPEPIDLGLKKGEPFDIHVQVQNNGPVPLNFVLDWTSQHGAPPLYPSNSDTVRHSGPGDLYKHGLFEVARRGKDGFDEPLKVGNAEIIGPDGSFALYWQWIDPENPAKKLEALAEVLAEEALEAVLDAVLNGLGTVKTLLETLDDRYLDSKRELKTLFWGSIVDSTTSGMPNVPVQELTIPISVKAEYVRSYDKYLLAKLAAEELVGKAIGAARAATTIASRAELVALVLGANEALTRAAELYEAAKDPPDPAFQQLARVERVTLPEVEALPNDTSKTVAKLSLELTAVTHAAFVSHNRADAAALAGDALWESRQLLAAAEFTSQASAIQSSLANHLRLMSQAFPLADSERAAYLETTGLPQSITDLLEDWGWSTEQLDRLRLQQISSAKDDAHSPDLGAKAMAASAILSSLLANEYLNEVVKMNVEELNQPVRSLTASERTQLDTLKAQIQSKLAQKIPTAALLDEVQSFSKIVRRLLELTNKPTELQLDLDFAVDALLGFQKMNPTLGGIQAVVAAEATKGNISAEAAVALNQALSAANSGAVTGDFAAVSDALHSFGSAVGSHQGQGIGTNLAAQLIEFGEQLEIFTTFRSAWHNATKPADVNGDTHISSIDLLYIVESLNANLAGPLPFEALASRRIDTSGDGNLSAIDLILEVEALNRAASQLNASLVSTALGSTSVNASTSLSAIEHDSTQTSVVVAAEKAVLPPEDAAREEVFAAVASAPFSSAIDYLPELKGHVVQSTTSLFGTLRRVRSIRLPSSPDVEELLDSWFDHVAKATT